MAQSGLTEPADICPLSGESGNQRRVLLHAALEVIERNVDD